MKIKTLEATGSCFNQQLDDVLDWSEVEDSSITRAVEEIINEIRQHGDSALLSYTKVFDQWTTTVDDLLVDRQQLEEAWNQLPDEQSKALNLAADRIRQYAEHQKIQSWDFTDEFGNKLGQKVTPLERVGVYVPGGKAAYPSSVLMNVIPAKVAGVSEIVMVTQPRKVS
jgi:Histidinol dehydrogenase